MSHAVTETEQRTEIRDWTDEMTERLLRDAGITEGMQVLDVGCANGDFTFAVARVVGERGVVIACGQNDECLDSAVCSNGVCVATCQADADCAADSVCYEGGCLLVTSEDCASNADCSEGVCQAGVCANEPPVLGCATDADCGEGAVCVSGECEVVTSGCASNADCAEERELHQRRMPGGFTRGLQLQRRLRRGRGLHIRSMRGGHDQRSLLERRGLREPGRVRERALHQLI